MPAKKEAKKKEGAEKDKEKNKENNYSEKAFNVVKNGCKVKVDYTGSLDDGTVFDSSEKHGQPLEFEVGAGQIIPGFEKGIMNMKKGEEKTIKLQPSEAYGDPNPDMVKKVPRAQLPKEQEPRVGMVLLISLPNGMQVPANITEVTNDQVSIDLNHPLAGKTLTFKIKVIDIS